METCNRWNPSFTMLSAVHVVIVLMLTLDCRRGHVLVSGRSLERLVVNATLASSSTQPTIKTVMDCQSVPHEALWARINLGPKPVELNDPAAAEFKEGDENKLVVDRSCSPRHHHHPMSGLRHEWHCEMEQCVLYMRHDVFPPTLRSSRCTGSRTCRYGLHECKARHHTVTLLRKLSASEAKGCLPVPTISSQTLYEDVWVAFDYKIIVSCECSNRRPDYYNFWLF